METRKITVVSTATQTKKVIMSAAETLRELKADFDAAGIDYNNMTFYEGVSKTELLNDDSVLPTNVPYTNRRTGESIVTNELVFMLTNKDKKIASGASRKELYEFIKSNDLQDVIKELYGKNFTQVSSENLENFMNNHKVVEEECTECEGNLFVLNEERYVLTEILNALYDNDIISYEKYSELIDMIAYKEENIKGRLESSYDDEEIEDMFENCIL